MGCSYIIYESVKHDIKTAYYSNILKYHDLKKNGSHSLVKKSSVFEFQLLKKINRELLHFV